MQRRLSASGNAPSTHTAPAAPSPSLSPDLPIFDDDANPFLQEGRQQAHAAHAPHSAHSHDGSSASEPSVSASAASPSASSFSFGSPIPFRFVPRESAVAAGSSAGSSSTSAASSFTPRAVSSVMSPAAEDRYLKVSVYFLTASMFFTFAMFAPVQNVVTTIFPSSGTISLVLVYAFFTGSTIVTPSLVRWMGPANGVVIGCSGYLLYTLGCLLNDVPFYLIASIVLGLCAGLIWTSQGAVLTMLSTTANRGMHSAFIIAGVNGGEIVSNIVLGMLLNARVGTPVSPTTGTPIETGGDDDPRPHRFSNAAIFLIFLCIGAAGFACFCILRIRMRTVAVILARREEAQRREDALLFAAAHEAEAERMRLIGSTVSTEEAKDDSTLAPDDASKLSSQPAPSAADSTSAVTMETPPSLLARFLEIFRLLGSQHYRHFLPILLIVQGMANSYFFSVFGVVMGRSYLGYPQALMSVIAVPTIFGVGWLLDESFPAPTRTYRKKWVILVTLSGQILFALLTGLTIVCSDGFTSAAPESTYPRTVSEQTFSFLVYMSAIVFGLAAAGTDIAMYYLLGQIFAPENRAETAFAAKSFSEAAGFCLSQAVLAIIPPKLYPFLAALWTIPVLLWYRHWTFPVDLMHSKSKKQVAEAELASRQNDVHTETSAVTIWH